jgi:hypothetical protein
MGRATKADQAQIVNEAYRLLDQRIEVADAAQQLAQTFALSRRQAYRYLEQAKALNGPVAAVEPTVAITFKLPVSTVRALRAYARRGGGTLGQIVSQALTAFLGAVRQRG